MRTTHLDWEPCLDIVDVIGVFTVIINSSTVKYGLHSILI